MDAINQVEATAAQADRAEPIRAVPFRSRRLLLPLSSAKGRG
jgi:hypothetical protein